ncbi:MAG: carbohydrate binding domain-containing protein [Planctomycetota bacterium]
MIDGRLRRFLAGGVLVAMAMAVGVWPAAADEFDQVVEKVDPPARFVDYQPDWSVSKHTFTFQHLSGPESWDFWGIKDGERYVALIPIPGFHSGTIYMQSFRPDNAPTELDVPSERWHIDTAVGTELQTTAWIPRSAGQKESSYDFEIGDGKLTMTRRFEGETTYNRWAHRDKKPQNVDVTSTFVFKVDPQLGYVVDGTYDVRAERFPRKYQFTSHAQSGRYAIWPGQETCYRSIVAPIGKEGYEGYYMNQPSIIRGRLSCRDGGFVGFLNDQTGWSTITTNVGTDSPIGICNAHADLDLTAKIPADLPADEDGMKHWVQKHRLLAAPPEVTAYLWKNMDVMFEGDRRVEIRVGRLEDFEAQPLPMTTRDRGLAFTGNDPELSTEHAHSGNQSLVVDGRVWPNIPQIALQPNQKYHLEAWMKVAADPDSDDAKAYIRADYYEWTPHNDKREKRQQTNAATAETDGWQKVSLEFTTPAWGPFVDLVFVCEGGTAYLDDLKFVPVKREPSAEKLGIRVDAHGRTYVAGKEVGRDRLLQMIRSGAESNPDLKVRFKIDKDAKFMDLYPIMDELKQSGLHQWSLRVDMRQ